MVRLYMSHIWQTSPRSKLRQIPSDERWWCIPTLTLRASISHTSLFLVGLERSWRAFDQVEPSTPVLSSPLISKPPVKIWAAKLSVMRDTSRGKATKIASSQHHQAGRMVSVFEFEANKSSRFIGFIASGHSALYLRATAVVPGSYRGSSSRQGSKPSRLFPRWRWAQWEVGEARERAPPLNHFAKNIISRY